MVEFLGPFLLIVMRWDLAAGPDAMNVRVHYYETREKCERSGRDLDELRARIRDKEDHHQWRCVRMPDKPRGIQPGTIE